MVNEFRSGQTFLAYFRAKTLLIGPGLPMTPFYMLHSDSLPNPLSCTFTRNSFMKRTSLHRLLPFRFALLVAPLVACWPTQVRAAGGSWSVDAAGNWSTASNWGGTVPITIAGDVINFNNALTVARTVTLDTTSRLIGDLNIGSSAAFGFTIAATGGAVINLDGLGAASGTIDFTGTVANAISAPISLIDNGIVRSNTAAVQTLSGIISGTGKSLTFNNDVNGTDTPATSLGGQFMVTGANTYSGGTSISDVRVQIQTSNTALGAAGSAVTIADGGQFYNSSGLQTINYAFSIAGNGWQETVGKLGALRLEGGAIVTGSVALTANAAVGSNATGTINGVISGNFGLTKVGTVSSGTNGIIVLGGANTYTGGTTIGFGTLQANNNSALGTGAVAISGTTARLAVNGGVTLPAANSIMVNTGVTGVAGTGLVMQTGTGQAKVNGVITLNSAPSAGGTFMGGNAVGNELVLLGAIDSPAGLGGSQRDGRVVYTGGGNASGNFLTTGTVLLGAHDGLPQAWALALGGSGPSTLNLNGFSQSLASLKMGNSGAGSTNFATSVLLGGNALLLNGDLTNGVAATQANVQNIISGPGVVHVLGGNLNISDNTLALDDVTISDAHVAGAFLTKTGSGTLALHNALVSPFKMSAGALQIGTSTLVGTANFRILTLNGGALKMKVGATGDLITTGILQTTAPTTVSLSQNGGILAPGSYPLITYSGTSPGLASLTLLPIGHATATLQDTGTAIVLNVTGNDRLIWDGTTSTSWATGTTGNWKLQSSPTTAADYIEGDEVIFNDGPTSSTVALTANVTPAAVTFNNTTATAYTVTGTGVGILGSTGLSKTGNGILTLGGAHQYGGVTNVGSGTLNLLGSLLNSKVEVAAGATLVATGTIGGTAGSLSSSGSTTLAGANTYTGATNILAGTTTASYTTAVALPAASAVSVASGANLKLTHAGGVFSLVNTLSGAGTVVVDPSTTTAGNRDIATVTWNASAFTGVLNLKPTLGTMRMQVDNANDLGGANVLVDSGAQTLFSGTLVIPNNFTISGVGFTETGGTLGAIRAGLSTTFNGVISLAASAKIGALGGTGISRTPSPALARRS